MTKAEQKDQTMGRWIGLSWAVLFAVLSGVGAEEEPGFVSLFNGNDFTGWVIMGKSEGWRVVEGTIHSDGGKGGAWIRTEKAYGNFILRLEWMLSTAGNSGVFIRTRPDRRAGSFEVQLLAPWKPPRDDLHCTGSIYGHVPVNPRPDETPNRWHRLEIACEGKQVTVKVDDQVCCTANMDQVDSLRNMSLGGHLGLQDSHTGPGQWVKFRNLRVKDLDADLSFVISQLSSPDAELRRRARESAERLGASMIHPLCKLLAQDDPASIRLAQGTLFALAGTASAPDSRERRSEVSRALVAHLGKGNPPRVRTYVARLLGLVGSGAETVPALADALRDGATHEAARKALQRIPGPAATQALLAALAHSPAEQKPGLIHALGARRDAGAVFPLSDLAFTGDEATRVAALQALGQIGNAAAARALQAGLRSRSAAVRTAAVEASLRLAAAQHTRNPALARQLYRRALSSAGTGAQKGAALVGLHAVGDPNLLPHLFAALRDEEARSPAFDLLQRLEGPEIMQAVKAELKNASGPERELLLQWVSDRDLSE